MRSMLHLLSLGACILVIALCGCDGDNDENVISGMTTARIMAFPEAGTTSTLFIFSAQGLNGSGQVISNTQARWDWNGDGVFDTPFLADQNVEHQFAAPATYTVIAQVRDSTGETINAITGIPVTVETNPIFVQLQATPETGITNTVFTFSATPVFATPFTRDQLIRFGEARWDFEDDGVYDTPFMPFAFDDPSAGSPPTATHKYGTAGVKRVRCQVRSGTQVGSDTVTVTVQ